MTIKELKEGIDPYPDDMEVIMVWNFDDGSDEDYNTEELNINRISRIKTGFSSDKAIANSNIEKGNVVGIVVDDF